jgi:hypothetical protein
MCDNNTYNECIQIIEDKNLLSHSQLNEKWPIFKIKFPAFYDMLTTTDNIDLNLLKYMCDSALKQTILPKEEKLEFDFKIGEKLAKKYIYSEFKEPTTQQKEFIKETMRKKINNEK